MGDIPNILFDEKIIAGKVKELASRISADYAGKELVLVSILKGAIIFTADLMRRLAVPTMVEFVQVASYGASLVSSGDITLEQDVKTDLRGKHVLIIDTIIDSGKTLEALLKKIAAHAPASLGAVVLLDKKSRRVANITVDYCGFEVSDVFVVGYGMDYAEHYRNLPYIGPLEPGA